MGWGGFLDKLINKLPIPDRVEGIKIKIGKLEKEKKELLKGQCDAKKAKRVADINLQLDTLNKRLSNIAKD